jgi:small redox-active disulfide protein 2
MEIKVVGGGCLNCKKLLEKTQEAVQELGVQADIRYVTDMEEIMKTGILHTPGLIVDGTVKVTGRVPNIKEIKEIIVDAQ